MTLTCQLDTIGSWGILIVMKTWTSAEVKNHFAKAIDQVERGEEITVTFGRTKKKVAVIVPYKKYCSKKIRRLGLLEGRVKYKLSKDFKVSEEELFSL